MVWVRPVAVWEAAVFFLGSRHDLLRFLGYLENPSSHHVEGDEEGGGGSGPGDEEGPAQGDEGTEGHEVSWGEVLPLVRSGSLVRAPAPACGCLHRVVERGPHGASLWGVEHGFSYVGSAVYASQWM